MGAWIPSRPQGPQGVFLCPARGAQCIAQRWVVNVLLVVLGCYLLGRFLGRLFVEESEEHHQTTLHDPQRLQRTLNLFATVPPIASGGGPGATKERHRTEALCRSLLEAMLGIKLPMLGEPRNRENKNDFPRGPKVRPRWLVNPTTKRSLEIDMYNEDHLPVSRGRHDWREPPPPP